MGIFVFSILFALCLVLAEGVSSDCPGAVVNQAEFEVEEAEKFEHASTSCFEISGDLIIDSWAILPIIGAMHTLGVRDLNRVFSVTGDWEVIGYSETKYGAGFNTLAQVLADQIVAVEGSVNVHDLPKLNVFFANNLNSTTNFQLAALPSLTSFEAPLNNVNGSISISNIGARSLGTTFSPAGRLHSLYIGSNNQLEEISLPRLQEIETNATIERNNDKSRLLLPSLRIVGNLEINGQEEIEMNSLENVTGKFEISSFHGTSLFFDSLDTIGNKNQTNGLLRLNGSSTLSDISFPKLRTVYGSIELKDLPATPVINGFPKLEVVTGNILIDGFSFKDAYFQSLKEVQGGFVLRSLAGSALDCSSAEKLRPLVRGEFVCTGTVKKTIPWSAVAGGTAAAVFLFSFGGYLYWKRRTREPEIPFIPRADIEILGESLLQADGTEKPAELTDRHRVELPGAVFEPVEMEGSPHRSELHGDAILVRKPDASLATINEGS